MSYRSPFDQNYNNPPSQQPSQNYSSQPSAGVYGGDNSSSYGYDSRPHQSGNSGNNNNSNNTYTRPNAPPSAPAPAAPSAPAAQMFNPAAMQQSFESFTSDPMKKVMVGTAVQMGSSFLGRYLPGVAILWETLRRYFAVDNVYVRSKLLRVLFPFRHRDWRRLEVSGGDGDSAVYAPPTKDTNAPDLYIPLMGAVTFVLIVSFVKGAAMNFTPDVLYEVSQHCMFMQIMEILVLKLLLYLLGHAKAQLGFFDILAFTGYKYVGLCVNMLVAYMVGWWVYYPVLLYTGLSMGFFIVQTFKASSVSGREGKTTMLLAAAGFIQLLVMWWLAYTGDITHGTGAVVLDSAGSNAAASLTDAAMGMKLGGGAPSAMP